MTLLGLFRRLSGNDGLNYLLTNRIPRRTATRLAGWISTVEQPVVRDLALASFRFFCAPDLSDARKRHFTSLRDCFIRELAEGARPVDSREEILVSPCDAIIGAVGHVGDGMLMQVKGSSYPLAELIRDDALGAILRDGAYATLRLTAGMYHRFHAPHDGRMERFDHIAGDVWNVNPATLARRARLYCRNERVVMRMRLRHGAHPIVLVPVAAVLVAGIKLNFAELPTDRSHRGPWSRSCDVAVAKGAELGWFEHGSTIILLAPAGFTICEPIVPGRQIRVGEALMRVPG
jgi:phosphatidylserine decarboxylase